MMKILLMLSLTLTVRSISQPVSYPTSEADAERMMLEIKRNPNAKNSKAIYSMLQTEHDKLNRAGYIFLGWRGIKPSKHQKTATPHIENVDDYLRHNNRKDYKNANFANKFYSYRREWQGMYLATFVDVCYGYVEELNDKRIDRNQETYLPWIFRVYLNILDIENVHDVQMWQNGDVASIVPNPRPQRRAQYIYYGREGPSETDYLGFEIVLSPSVAQKARFLLSTFTATGYTVRDKQIIKGNSIDQKISLCAKNKGELYERTMRNYGTAKEKLVGSKGQNRFKI